MNESLKSDSENAGTAATMTLPEPTRRRRKPESEPTETATPATPKVIKLSDPPTFDTGYLAPKHAMVTMFWDGFNEYWKLCLPIDRARRLRDLLGPFDPKHPPTVTPADVMKALREVYGG